MTLDLFKYLLPRARAWSLTKDRPLRRFFDGLSVVVDDSRSFLDDVYDDLNPAETRRLNDWERQFGLLPYALTEQQRRNRVDAQWKFTGGQSPGYIQDTLQRAGFDVYVHEWWVPGSNPPVARDPNAYLRSTIVTSFNMRDNEVDSQDGDPVAQDGSSNDLPGYPLVNKVVIATQATIGDGSASMQDGGELAVDGIVLVTFNQRQYTIPSDPTQWPYFLYIGGETFPEQATVLESRREEFEDLCLKICPTEQWLGLIVDYQ